MKIDQATLVITGGAAGIGLAIARLAAERGANVVLMDRDAEALARAEASLPVGHVVTVAADVTRPAGHEAAVEIAVGAFGGFDVWVNNAGLARHAAIPDYTEGQIDLMMDVNLKGTVLGSQAALRHLMPKRSGTIINIISTAGLRGIPTESVYCATKWAVRGFTQALQEEAAGYGIGVTAILPGGVDTAFWDTARQGEVPRDAMLDASQVAQATLSAIELSGTAVVRELQVRGINDRDFGS